MIFRLLSILLLATPSLTLPSLSPRQRCVPSNETCGCSSTSFSSWSWSVTDLYYHSSIVFSTPAHQIPNGMISFSLAHPAMPGVSLACSASSTQLQDFFYGNQYFSCTNGNVTDETATRATFRFDKATGRVDLNQTWTCTDVDPVYPIYFKASGSANASLSCNRTTWQNENWTMGQIFSTDIVECAKLNMTVKPTEVSAIS